MHYRQLNALYSDPLWDLNEECWYWDLWKMKDTDFGLATIYMLTFKIMYQKQYPLEYSWSYQLSHTKLGYKKNNVYKERAILH